MSTLGLNIKTRRESLELTQTGLAKLVGLATHAPISKMEAGLSRPDEEMLKALAVALKCSPEDLTGKPLKLLVLEEDVDPLDVVWAGNQDGKDWTDLLQESVTPAGHKALFRMGSILDETFEFQRADPAEGLIRDYLTGFHETIRFLLDTDGKQEPILWQAEASGFLRRLYDHNATKEVQAEMRMLIEVRKTRREMNEGVNKILDRLANLEARLGKLEDKANG